LYNYFYRLFFLGGGCIGIFCFCPFRATFKIDCIPRALPWAWSLLPFQGAIQSAQALQDFYSACYPVSASLTGFLFSVLSCQRKPYRISIQRAIQSAQALQDFYSACYPVSASLTGFLFSVLSCQRKLCLYFKGDTWKCSLTYLPKKEVLEKPRIADISLTDLLVERR